jgi:hypothetical protein
LNIEINKAYPVSLIKEAVLSHEIKKELIEPIENMENKLEVKNRLTSVLFNVRPALMKSQITN